MQPFMFSTAKLAKENFIFMNIIGDILGVAIESFGNHYLELHSKLVRNSSPTMKTWLHGTLLKSFNFLSNHITRGSNHSH
jgi:hypothetical protein